MVKADKNGKFVEYYVKALGEKSDKPVTIKVLQVKIKQKKIEKEESKDSDSYEESKGKEGIKNVSKKIILATQEEIDKIAFVYLFRKIDTLDFDISKVREMPTLIKNLSKQIKTTCTGAKGYFDDKGDLVNEPYSVNITSNVGKLTPINNIDHLFEMVRSFPVRKKVYFNIKPYFDIDVKASRKNKKEKVIVANQIVSDMRVRESSKGEFDSEANVLSEQNFYETLDERTKGEFSYPTIDKQYIFLIFDYRKDQDS